MSTTQGKARGGKSLEAYNVNVRQTRAMKQKAITDAANDNFSDSTSKAIAIPLASSSSTGFLDLSPELRNEIYMLCLRADGGITIRHQSGPTPSWARKDDYRSKSLFPNLLATCSIIHAEATPVLYGSHRFGSREFGSKFKNGKTFFDSVGKLARESIRRVELSGDQFGQLPHILDALGECAGLESLVLSSCYMDGRHTLNGWVSKLKPMVQAWQDTSQDTDAEAILEPLKLWSEIRAPRYRQLREAIMTQLMAVLVRRQKDLVG